MNELIKVNYDTEQPTVSARGLHRALEIEKRFSAWFETNSQGFVEGEDFTSVLSGTVVNNGAHRELQDYIDLEKAWNTPEQIMARALRMADQTIESLKERCAFLGGQVEEQQQVIEELQPKATYYDLILQCPDLVSTTEIAKDYGMSAKKFNALLHDLKIQFKQSGVWFLYQKYAGFGYTKSKTHNYSDEDGIQHSRQHMYWTQKGRLFLYEHLKGMDIVPLIEQAA